MDVSVAILERRNVMILCVWGRGTSMEDADAASAADGVVAHASHNVLCKLAFVLKGLKFGINRQPLLRYYFTKFTGNICVFARDFLPGFLIFFSSKSEAAIPIS